MKKTLHKVKLVSSFFTVAFLLFAKISQAQNVTNIYTDFGSWWASGVGNINVLKPNDKNDLLGFTAVRVVSGVPATRTFSTGVNDNLLTANGINFTPGDYRALPVGAISGTPTASTFVGVGNNYGGVNQSITHPSLTNPMNFYLTDGKHGLDMATAVFNVQNGSIFYKVDEFNIAAIGDGMPDIIATQMGDYPATNDVFKFVDNNGVTVGNQISLDFSQVISVGNASWSFYTVPVTSPYVPMAYGGPHGDRLMRLRAWDLGDFGLNQNNVGRISRFVHTLSGSSDPAFMAYNTTGFRALTTIIPGCGEAAPGMWLQANDGITLASGLVTAWNDQGSKGLNMEQTTPSSRPAYKDGTNSGFNFNPYVDFKNGSWLGHANSPFTAATNDLEVFIVARPSATSGTNKIMGFSRSNADVSGSSKGDFPAFSFDADGKLNISYGADSKLSTSANNHSVSGLWEMTYSGSSGTISSTLNGVASGTGAGSMDLGMWYSQLGDATPGDNQADFDLGEVIVFPAGISADQKKRTSSYLAIKYGISLPFSYVSGSGTTIWDYSNNVYNNHIIGVGREDCQGLAQKQSSSITDPNHLLTVGMSTIAATTKENLTTMADGQYMLWGDNDGSLTNTSSLKAQNLCLKKSEIIWRNQRTGNNINTQGTQVKIHVSQIAWAEPARGSSAANYYLLVDRNANGNYNDPGDLAIPATSLTDGYATFNHVIWDQDGSGTDLFTVALKVDELPVLTAITGSNTSCIGSTTALSNTVAGGTWTSSDPLVATINPVTGLVMGVQAGTTLITYSVTNTQGCAATVTKNIVVNTAPTAIMTGGGIVCEGQATPQVAITFTGTAPWSFIYTNGTSSTTVNGSSANQHIISEASAGTYALTALNDANCAGILSESAVTVISKPAANVIQPSCAGDKGSIQVAQPVGTGILYSINGVDYQSSTVFGNLDPGTYNLTASNGICNSAPSVLTINASPTAPTPVVSQPTCQVATGSITVPAAGGAQYSIDNGQTYQAENIFTDLASGVYHVSMTNNGCTSPTQEIVILAQPATPAAPLVASPVIYCNGVSVNQLEATGTNLLWYNTASGGVGNVSAPAPATSVSETRLFYVSQSSASGCESERAAIEVTVKPVPFAPSISVLNNCDGTSTLTAGNFNGTLLWNTAATTAGIVVNSAGNYTLSQTIDGCTSANATASAAPKSIPSTPVISVLNNCDGTSTMTASNHSGTLLWSNGAVAASQTVNIADTYILVQTVDGCVSTPASATTAPKTTPARPTVTVSDNCGSSTLTANSSSGTFLWSNGAATNSTTVTSAGTYTVTRTVNACTSPAGSGTAAPATSPVPTGSAAQTFCGTNDPTVASLVTVETIVKWYDASSAGNLLTGSTSLVDGKIYYASQTLNGCESSGRLAVTVTVTAASAPSGAATQTFCQSEAATIAGLTVSGSNIKWYDAQSGGNVLGENATLVDRKIYYALQTIGACEGVERLAIAVIVNETPTVSLAGNDQQHCNDSEFVMNANNSLIGIGKWEVKSGAATITDESDPETMITVAPGSTAVLSWVITNGSCSSASDVSLSNEALVSAGPDQSLSSANFTMAADRSVGVWQIVSVLPANMLSQVSIADVSLYDTKITVPNSVTAVFSWTVDGASCSDLVEIANSNPLPVTLISFTAMANDQKVRLSWSTSSETKNLGFDIERSADARTFSVIGFVAANTDNDTRVLQNYQFTDENPFDGTSYYRLVQKDTDGTTALSRIVPVNIFDPLSIVELYPNPTQKIVHFKNLKKGAKVNLINNSGVTVSVSYENYMNVESLTPGVYYLKIVSGESVQTLKFIKY